jgi:hypothetical protein
MLGTVRSGLRIARGLTQITELSSHGAFDLPFSFTLKALTDKASTEYLSDDDHRHSLSSIHSKGRHEEVLYCHPCPQRAS